ncbi:YicC/YloC family endoribonuclease [Spirochaeta cellobiosiphila]|uniref:YicC/YloC family endoribonuclease n=1 Tax=Spirochaeta cellobiosiphila TaxID=504483 RepID=UPI001FE16E9D|nr:YicC/YloC family endoribonuclease [Spirochaeta cellobiosiphila]
MTGFGFAELEDNKYQITLDIKTYNNRYLDLILNIPNYLNPLEPKIRELIAQNFKRGRIEVYLRYKEINEDIEVIIDECAVMAYNKALNKILDITGIKEEVSLNHILKQDGVIKTEKNRNIDVIWNQLQHLFVKAIQDVQYMRSREGELTSQDIKNNLESIKSFVANIELHRPIAEETWKQSLIDKLQEVTTQIEEQRVLTEVAVLAAKLDINEEIQRLYGHIEGMFDMMISSDPVGKKMDFLSQEMNREVNTIGSKMGQIEIQKEVVNIKDCLEKIREQLRNVE